MTKPDPSAEQSQSSCICCLQFPSSGCASPAAHPSTAFDERHIHGTGYVARTTGHTLSWSAYLAPPSRMYSAESYAWHLQ